MSLARLARCSGRASVGVAVVTLLAACGTNSASQTSTSEARATRSTQASTKPAPQTVSAPQPKPIIVPSLDGKSQVGVLRLTSIERTTSVIGEFGNPGPGDYLVIRGEFENTSNNTSIGANNVLAVGRRPVPCSSVLCNPGLYKFSTNYDIQSYAEHSSVALGGQTVPYAVFINLNPGSIRQNPAIKDLGSLWIVPGDNAAMGAGNSFGLRRALQLSEVWGSGVITYG